MADVGLKQEVDTGAVADDATLAGGAESYPVASPCPWCGHVPMARVRRTGGISGGYGASVGCRRCRIHARTRQPYPDPETARSVVIDAWNEWAADTHAGHCGGQGRSAEEVAGVAEALLDWRTWRLAFGVFCLGLAVALLLKAGGCV